MSRPHRRLDRQLTTPLSSGPLGHQPPPQEDADDGPWRARLYPLLDGPVTDALRRLRMTLATTTLPAARPDDRPGLVHLPGGAEHYERLVWSQTTLGRTAAEVHAIGLEQVDRLEVEYRTIAGPLLGTSDLSVIYRTLRDDPNLHYRDAATLVRMRSAPWPGRKRPRRLVRAVPTAPCVARSIEQGALAFYSRPARTARSPAPSSSTRPTRRCGEPSRSRRRPSTRGSPAITCRSPAPWRTSGCTRSCRATTSPPTTRAGASTRSAH